MCEAFRFEHVLPQQFSTCELFNFLQEAHWSETRIFVLDVPLSCCSIQAGDQTMRSWWHASSVGPAIQSSGRSPPSWCTTIVFAPPRPSAPWPEADESELLTVQTPGGIR